MQLNKKDYLMKKISAVILFIAFLVNGALAQTGTEFWFAAPEVTSQHNDAGPTFRFTNTSKTLPCTVNITMPAAPWITIAPIIIPANSAASLVLDAAPNNLKDTIENKPTNKVLNKGIHITSNIPITAYYEVNNSNNNEIFALKGPNGLGQEFYIPLTNNPAFLNHIFLGEPRANATFDIVATQDNTKVQILTHVPVDGHAANVPFTVTLNKGQTYSCGATILTTANYWDPANHPSGSVVLSDKPIAITVKDDSDHTQGTQADCYDLIGDQIVPVDIIGNDYIVIKGQLTANHNESFNILATQNNTKVYVDGNPTPVATLFAGQTYYQTNITNPRYYIHTDRPVYCTQITGFGCELGSAILPPLNCAGSQSVTFVRSTNEGFFLNIMVKAGAEGSFKFYGGSDSLIIQASDFAPVPGTSGEWLSTYGKGYGTGNATGLSKFPVGTNLRLINTKDNFALGLINGDVSTGCRFGFFSEYAAPIVVNANSDQTICANSTATLSGTVSGGATTGIWSTAGTGTFTPNSTSLNAVYTPSPTDIANGHVDLTLTSTSMCFAVSDIMRISFSPAPTANAGPDQSVCANNANVTLAGSVTIASGGMWTGGAGTYSPNNTTLNAVYIPTAAEIAAGSLTLTLTTTGNASCNPVSDIMVITFTPKPKVNAGLDLVVCGNNPSTPLNGQITGATGGIWSGGGGFFNPSNTSLGAVYTPSAAEITAGSVILTLTSTGNNNCNAEFDAVKITITPMPTANAGTDFTVCANNSAINLNGSITVASGGVWSGGFGAFSPNNTTLVTTYFPTAAEIAAGVANLVLTTNGNGNCLAVADNISIAISPGPTANAGTDIIVAANNLSATLNGSVTVSGGGSWSGGTGTYTPNNSALNAIYTPSASETTAGGLNLTLTSTGNGNCTPVTDVVHITISPAPIVNAGLNIVSCANSPTVTLNGLVTNATGGIWSGGTGIYNPSNIALNAIYTPSAAEISAGTVTLTLTSTGNGNATPVSDNVVITITPAPIVNAGADQTLCSNNQAVHLNGSVANATGGQWTGGLGIFVPNSTTLNAVYQPTAAEITSGTLTLTLSSTGNGSCFQVSDNTIITFTTAPTANAGADITVCGNNQNAALTGLYTIAGGCSWTGGLGSFSPNNTTTNAIYTPTAGEISTGTVNLVLTTTSNGNCISVSDNVVIIINPAPIVNAGSNLVSCFNNPTVTLNGSALNATGGKWTGGLGFYNPGNTTLNATYAPTAAEIASGTVNLTLTSTGNGTCNSVSDNMTITISPAPIVNAGPNQTLCSNSPLVHLNGNVSNATGAAWSGGLGVFSPNNKALNATYMPTVSEINSGFVVIVLTSTGNGSCIEVSDNLLVSFTSSPTVAAGSDITVCANNPNAVLNGQVTIASGGIWSGGYGTFIPNNTTLSPVYIPTPSEILSGGVDLILTSTGNGNCTSVSDLLHINILPSPLINAGADLVSCVNSPSVTLNGNVLNCTGGQWSGGSGVFTPSNSVLNAIYTPGADEILAGQAILTLTSTGNSVCNPVTDQVKIVINPAPTTNAGIDQFVCANNPAVTLNGSVTIAAGGIWTGGLGLYNPNSSVLNSVYTPTTAEILSGGVTLTLTTVGNGTCLSVTDQMHITYSPAPVANAGINQNICSNNPAVILDGSYSVASGIIWSGGLGSFSPNNTSINAAYIPNAGEIASGNVSLTLTTTGNGNCLAVNDQMEINYTPSPIVSAGLDQTICVDQLNVALAGNVIGPTSTGIWNSTGTGIFIPNNTTLNATYKASQLDSLQGSFRLKLTSTGNGTCIPVSDSILITILPSGIADAGADQTVCANNSNIFLNGKVSGGASNGLWTTTGTGTFVPDPNVLNPMYVPSQGDALAGTITLSLEANSCNHASDQMVLTITPSPDVNAGPDLTVCVSNLDVQLDGKISGGTTTGIWTTPGTGTFTPNNTAMKPVYRASAEDSISGKVILILTSTNYANCLVVSDTMVIHILKAGIVNAGPDQTHCSNELEIELNGSISGGATTGIWSGSGTGDFLPDNTALNAIYKPSAADTAVGVVNFVLSATNSCNIAFDMMQLNLTNGPYVDAGSNSTVCRNNAVVVLSGMVSFATGGLWSSSGTGTFFPDNNTLTASYLPSNDDLNNGSTFLYLLSTNNGNCKASKDSVSIIYSPEPKASAGIDQIVCSSSPSTNIFGFVSGGGTSGIWSTLGTGTFSFPVSNSENQYNFSPDDKSNGFVELVLTSTNNGNCLEDADTMKISFGKSVFAYAGADQKVCEVTTEVNLSGVITGGSSSGEWSSFGTGTFLPDNLALNPRYQFSSVDSLLGYAQLILTSTNNGSCDAGVDTVMINIQKKPVVDAGPDLQICKGTPSVNLIAQILNTESIKWTTSGSGTFSPDDSNLNPTYTFSKVDSISGNVKIYLTSTGTGICSPVKDTVNIQMFVPVAIDFSNSLACTGLQVYFTDESVVNHGTLTNWQWNFGNGNIVNSQDAKFIFPTLGSYPVSLTTTSSLGCSFTKTKQVVVNPAPVAAFGNVPSCNGYQVLFTDLSTLSSGNISSWHWDFGNGNTSNIQNPQNTYPSAGTYNVSLIVKSNAGCDATATKPVDISLPVAGFTYNSTSLQTGETILFSDQSANAQNWRWNFGGAGNSTLQSPEFTFNTQGTYTVVQIVTNQYNCSDTASTDIVIENNKAFSPKVPTGFSPNSDNNNDVLFVRGGPFNSMHFKIYDQWGKVVFETNDPTMGWDGKYKSVDQPIGLYVYTVEAETVDGQSYAKSGEVTLIR